MAGETIFVKKDGSDALAAASVVNTALAQAGGILESLLKASLTNPLVGILVTLTITDILANAKIINTDTQTMIKVMIGAGVGIELATEVIGEVLVVKQVLAGVSNIFGGKSSNANLFTPSATTIVMGENRPVGVGITPK